MSLTETEKGSLPVMNIQRRKRTVLHDQDVDPRWLLVGRIIDSRSLGKSELLARFLQYVCDRKIRGRESEITEQQIGVRVFGRPEGYNSNEDNIVRSYARTLRKRIGDYYKREGWEEPLLLCIPRGGYVPIFSLRNEVERTHETTAIDDQLGKDIRNDLEEFNTEKTFPLEATKLMGKFNNEQSGMHLSSFSCGVGFVGLLLLSLIMVILGFLLGQTRYKNNFFSSRAAKSSNLLWSELFTDNRDTFIVPADGGLVMMQSFTKDKVTLSDYINGSYRSDTEIDRGLRGLIETVHPEDQMQLVHKVSVLAARRYTSVADLGLATKFAQINSVFPERLVIRFARDVRMDDLHTGNAILLGSSDANPWVSLFEQQLNFQFSRGNEFGGSGTIRNIHPLPGEQENYASITGDPSNTTYGVIAYVPNLEKSGHILLIEGVNMAGTQAAGEFALHSEQMRPLIERALDSHGRLQAFEVLLKTTSIASNASGAEVLSERVHLNTSP